MSADFWGDLATPEPDAPKAEPATPEPALTPAWARDTADLSPAEARAMAVGVRALDIAAHCKRLADICREAHERDPACKYLAASVVWCGEMEAQFRELAAKQKERLG